jgi:hypothetical protein
MVENTGKEEVGEFIARCCSLEVFLLANNAVMCGNENSRNFEQYG